MITPISLHEAVNEFIKENVANKIKLKSGAKIGEDIEYKEPQVILGYLVPKIGKDKRNSNQDENSEYPFIATRITNYKNKGNYTEVNLKFIFGVYCYGSYENDEFINDATGYRDILNLAEKTRQELFKQKILNKRFEILEDFEMKIPEEHPYPYWLGEMTTKWIIPNVITE